jgi:hypothetical protein
MTGRLTAVVVAAENPFGERKRVPDPVSCVLTQTELIQRLPDAFQSAGEAIGSQRAVAHGKCLRMSSGKACMKISTHPLSFSVYA